MLTAEAVQVPSRKELITNWYTEAFPHVARYVHKHGGDAEMAKEVFQEAIVLYYEKLVSGHFSPQTNDTAYLIGIAKNRWLKYCAKHSRFEGLPTRQLEDEKEVYPDRQKLVQYLKQAGEKCMQVLQAFYYEKESMQRIARRFGFGSERSATVQKYKCLEKVRNNVKRKSMQYEDFLT